MSNTFAITPDLSGLEALVDAAATALDECARPAAQAGAQVLYEAVLRNVSQLGRVTGNLASSIYQAYSENNSGPGRATYHVSWNARKAPHGHLVEYGHLQRYEIARDPETGRLYPRVRPGMQGKPKPGRRASQAEKDAYYVTLPVPRQIPGKAFVRGAMSQFPAAQAAMQARFLEEAALRGIVK